MSISEVPPWYSLTQAKLSHENESAQALWDVPVYADSISEGQQNRPFAIRGHVTSFL